MTCDLWDVGSGNVVNTLRIRDDALAGVRTLLELNGAGYARSLSLGQEDDDAAMQILAEGDDLGAWATGHQRARQSE